MEKVSSNQTMLGNDKKIHTIYYFYEELLDINFRKPYI